jgi:hypothetical protein
MISECERYDDQGLANNLDQKSENQEIRPGWERRHLACNEREREPSPKKPDHRPSRAVPASAGNMPAPCSLLDTFDNHCDSLSSANAGGC